MAGPGNITPNLIAYLSALRPVNYSDQEGTPGLGVTLFNVATHRTYKADGGDNFIDESIGILVKLADKAQVQDFTEFLITSLKGNQVADAEIEIIEASLTAVNPIQKEQEKVFYQVLIFRFVGNFL